MTYQNTTTQDKRSRSAYPIGFQLVRTITLSIALATSAMATAELVIPKPPTLVSASRADGPDGPTYPVRGRSAVVDVAKVLSTDEQAMLATKIASYMESSHHQLAIVTVPSLGESTIADYGYQLGRLWGIGDAHNNDGALIILAPNERKVRIEVGYGLEGELTDAVTSLIIARHVVPELKMDHTAAALAAAIDGISEATPASEASLTKSKSAEEPTISPMLWFYMLAFAGTCLACVFLSRKKQEADADDATRNRQTETAILQPHNGTGITTAAVVAAMTSAGSEPERPRRRGYAENDSEAFSTHSSTFGSSSVFSDSSSSSSSGFDSGGGSFGGGGADSSY